MSGRFLIKGFSLATSFTGKHIASIYGVLNYIFKSLISHAF